MRTPSSEEVAWAAGWFEGEGSIPRSRRKPAAARISIINTDLDCLRSFQALFDAGSIYDMPLVPGARRKWQWQVCGEDAIEILRMLYPWLHERRKTRIDELLQARADAAADRRCVGCGCSFTPTRLGYQKFCSRQCGITTRSAGKTLRGASR